MGSVSLVMAAVLVTHIKPKRKVIKSPKLEERILWQWWIIMSHKITPSVTNDHLKPLLRSSSLWALKRLWWNWGFNHSGPVLLLPTWPERTIGPAAALGTSAQTSPLTCMSSCCSAPQRRYSSSVIVQRRAHYLFPSFPLSNWAFQLGDKGLLCHWERSRFTTQAETDGFLQEGLRAEHGFIVIRFDFRHGTDKQNLVHLHSRTNMSTW